MAGRRTFADHLHPPLVRRRSLQPGTTMGLGIACLTCLALCLVTGLALFAYYVPTEAEAYERILHITTTLPYGALVRDLHFVSANALIVCGGLHLARIVGMGSYKRRWLNWLYGLALLAAVLVSNYTGYLLPWDQTALWAAKVGARMAAEFPLVGRQLQVFVLGGDDVGADTLPRVFALHAGVLPALLATLTVLHLWRVRRDGGLAHPPTAAGKVAAHPSLYQAEAAAALLTFAGLLALALALDAPLAERADALHPPNPAKAPWYFVGVQEMVSYSAWWGGVVVPALLAGFLIALPRVDRSGSPGGVWLASDRRGWCLLFALLLLSQVAFIILGQWFRGENWVLQVPF